MSKETTQGTKKSTANVAFPSMVDNHYLFTPLYNLTVWVSVRHNSLISFLQGLTEADQFCKASVDYCKFHFNGDMLGLYTRWSLSTGELMREKKHVLENETMVS